MEPQTEPTWAVVATVREPSPLVAAFAAHHLSLGATELWLCFDDPADPAADLLTAVPGVHVLRCDQTHWQALGGRPALQTARQRANATLVAERSAAEWLLHIDADEFLWCDQPLSADIDRLGPEHLWLKLPVAERVWVEGQPDARLFDGAFRLPLPDDNPLPEAVYGAQAPLLWRGLAGHPVGKGLTRLGHGLDIGVHSPIKPGADRADAQPASRQAWHSRILHFDGLTSAHWCRKSAAYAAQGDAAMDRLLHPARRAQIAQIRAGTSASDLHRALFRLTLDQAAALDEAGAMAYAHLTPEVALPDMIGHTLDLSPATFDAGL